MRFSIGGTLDLMRSFRRLRALKLLISFVLLSGILYGGGRLLPAAPKPSPVKAAAVAAPHPLTADEQAALRWLDHVSGPLPDAEEKEWWQFGGDQFGLSAMRYHLAFAGYAAAALGRRLRAGHPPETCSQDSAHHA